MIYIKSLQGGFFGLLNVKKREQQSRKSFNVGKSGACLEPFGIVLSSQNGRIMIEEEFTFSNKEENFVF